RCFRAADEAELPARIQVARGRLCGEKRRRPQGRYDQGKNANLYAAISGCLHFLRYPPTCRQFVFWSNRLHEKTFAERKEEYPEKVLASRHTSANRATPLDIDEKAPANAGATQ